MNRLKTLSAATLIALPMLSGCGLRGELERPEPILQEAPKEKPQAVTTTTTRRVVTRQVATGPRRNADGGIIPNAAPSVPVTEGGLADIPPQ